MQAIAVRHFDRVDPGPVKRAGNRPHMVKAILVTDRLLIGIVAQAIDRLAHDQRRLGRIENDDGLAARGTTHVHDRLACRLGEFVDIGAGAGPCALAGDRGDDLAIVDLGHAAHRSHDRDGCLASGRP